MFSPSLDLARIAGGSAGADIDTGFGSVPQGWISSYAIGMFGAFDLTLFTDDNTLNKGLTLVRARPVSAAAEWRPTSPSL